MSTPLSQGRVPVLLLSAALALVGTALLHLLNRVQQKQQRYS